MDIVEIVSWNDFGESHYIGPIEGNQPMSQAWVDGNDHTGAHSLLYATGPILKPNYTDIRLAQSDVLLRVSLQDGSIPHFNQRPDRDVVAATSCLGFCVKRLCWKTSELSNCMCFVNIKNTCSNNDRCRLKTRFGL